MNLFLLSLRRELLTVIKSPSHLFNPLLFFIISVSLFPLAISPQAQVLSEIAPGIIWVCAMLSVLLSLNNIFYYDYENGSLEQIVMSKHSLVLLVLSKITAHWLTTGLPIILISPLLTLLLFLDSNSTQALMLTLLIGTPSLSLIGAIGGALTVSLKNSGMLLSLMVLPLYIPVLIFAVSAISYAQQGLSFAGQLYFLGFITSLSLMIAPILSKMAVKISLE